MDSEAILSRKFDRVIKLFKDRIDFFANEVSSADNFEKLNFGSETN